MSGQKVAIKTTEDGIVTARLFLLHSSPEHLSALITRPAEYHRVFGDSVAEGYMDYPGALEFSLRQTQLSAALGHWWLPYLIIHRQDARLIGVCGYKGPPTGDAVGEIGYSIAPTYRGQGLATEAASALTDHALSLPGILITYAHTLPSINASTRVLTKCGFTHVSDFDDPEDGAVWRWELRRPRTNAGAGAGNAQL